MLVELSQAHSAVGKRAMRSNEAKVLGTECTETLKPNYPRSAAIVTLAESERYEARSAIGTIPPVQPAGMWDSNHKTLNYPYPPLLNDGI